jgi:protein SCO1/2
MLVRLSTLAICAALTAFAVSGEASAQYYGNARESGPVTPVVRPAVLDEVGIDQRVGNTLPLDARVTTHDGRSIRFGELFDHGRPVIVQFAYYTCPSLCTMVVKGLVASLQGFGWTPGEQFDVVTVSVDPRDTVAQAASKRAEAVREYGREVKGNGWTFVVGTEENVRAIADAAGFRYAWDDQQQQYAHAAALVFASPNGHLSRYLFGLEYDSTELRLALIDASEGKAISAFDPILRYCYTFNGSKYVLVATQLMKLTGAVTLLLVCLALGFFWFREFRGGPRDGGSAPPPGISPAV